MKPKPYYRFKGRYSDGRKRCLIEVAIDRWSVKSKALPKPEILQEILVRTKWTKSKSKKHPKIIIELNEPKVNENETIEEI